MWSSRLIAALHSPTGKPRISLNRLGWANTPGQNTATARSTWNTAGVIGISPSAGFSVASQSIGVPDWTSNRGTLRIGFGGLEHARWASSEVPRGAIARVALQYPGMTFAEDVWVGRITAHDGIGPQLILSGWDILAAASSRAAFIGAGESELFYHCDPDSIHTAQLAHTWSAGTHTTLQFASPPQHEKETGQPGAVLVTPTSGADPFILTWTGKSGNDLTGVSTAGVFGTTETNAAAGSTVQEVCWIDDTPVRAAAKILASTGAGTNGAYDTLPYSWGYGFDASLIDVAGIVDAGAAMAPASGTHEVLTVSTTRQPQGFAWLTGVLQSYACWLTMRQGQITARAAVDRWAAVPPAVMTLGADSILRAVPVRSIYDPSSSVEYGRVRAVYGAGTTISGGATLPATRPAAIDYDTDYGFQLYQNQVAIADKLNERIGAWQKRIPSVVDVQATLSAAQLCPGDWIVLAHRGIWTVSNPTGGPVYAMVGSISTDWGAGVVSLRLYIQHRQQDA